MSASTAQSAASGPSAGAGGQRAAFAVPVETRQRFRELVEERYGVRVAEHQESRLDAELIRLCVATGYGTAQQLFDALAAGLRPDLLEALAAAMTIGETHFFRVGPQIEALRRAVLPELIQRRAAVRRLRAWSAGCSTGEEAYTLAILLREQLPAIGACDAGGAADAGGGGPAGEWDVQILASDVNPPALAAARQAVYGNWSFRDTPPEVRQRYFASVGNRWQLIEPVRRLVHFRQLNLVADSFPLEPHTRFDLILCRNVTIYFNAATTQRLYRRLADALHPDGWLVLGPSDPVPERETGLRSSYFPGAVLWRSAEQAVRRPPPASDAGVAGRVAVPRPLPGVKPPLARRVLTPAPGQQAGQRPGQPDGLRKPLPAASPAPSRIGDVGQDLLEARERAERGARERPMDAEAHLLLGMLYLDHGEPGALDALRRAAFLDSGNALAHFAVARVHAKRGELGRARASLTHARRLIAALPDDAPLAGGAAAGELRHAIDAQLRICM